MLPTKKFPTDDILIPSIGEKRKFRPFLVQEEKILLMADSAIDNKEYIVNRSCYEVITACYADEKPLDTSKLAAFDILYLFLKLRAISVSNIMTMKYRDGEDEKVRTFDLDLNSLELTQDPNHSNVVELYDDLKMKLRYPAADMIANFEEDDTVADFINKVALNSIDMIYDSENVYEDYTEEELAGFFDTLPVGTFKKIQQFFDTMPKVKYDVKYTNDKGNDVVITLSTLPDFFIWLWGTST